MRRLLYAITCVCVIAILTNFAHAIEPEQSRASQGDWDPYGLSTTLLEGFAHPPRGYGQVPFWWWTGEKLNVERLNWQLDALAAKGIPGVQVNYAHQDVRNEKQPNWLTFPNEPEVLTDEWFDDFTKVASHAHELQMGVGLSGYTLDWQNSPGNLFDRLIYCDEQLQGRTLYVAARIAIAPGTVWRALLERGDFQEAIRVRDADDLAQIVAYPKGRDGVLATEEPIVLGLSAENNALWDTKVERDCEVWVYRARRQAHTLNPLHPLAGQRVVERFLEPFAARARLLQGAGADEELGADRTLGLNYFFQDELQLGTGETSWYDDVPEEFFKRQGYSYWSAAPAMFNAQVGAKGMKYRLDFMALRVRLAEERYFIPIYHWHADAGRIYACDPGSRGRDPSEFCDYYSAIRWYTAPGHDTPGGRADFIKNKVSSSIAHFYERPRVWLEGYHSFGWGAAPEKLLDATNDNFLFGANLLNLHGLYYTTYGGFWEWAPPCYHFRQPYWENFEVFLRYFERLSFALTRGVEQTEFVVLYPTSPYHARLDGARARDVAFEAAQRLFNKGHDVLFIDDESLARAEVKDGRLCVAGASHRVLILPSIRAIHWSTLSKALELYRHGGVVIALDALPEGSDRIGTDDPLLKEAIQEIFGVTAGTTSSETRHLSGGRGVYLGKEIDHKGADSQEQVVLGSKATPSYLREYPGGFQGRWVWSEQEIQDVWFKWVASGLGKEPKEYKALFYCDNDGKLYVNGRLICENVNYSDGWHGALTLHDGDVITLDCHDQDAPRRGSAGVFFALTLDDKTVMSSESLRYSKVAFDANARRNAEGYDALAPVDVGNVHVLHRTGVNSEIAGSVAQNSDATLWERFERELTQYPCVTTDSAGQGLGHMKRATSDGDLYFLSRAKQGELMTFRSRGRALALDAWTGEVREIPDAYESTTSDGAACMRLRWPFATGTAGLILFSAAESTREPLKGLQTNLAELTELTHDAQGRWTARGYLSSEDAANGATAELTLSTRDGKSVTLRGKPSQNGTTLTLSGDWETEFIPTLDNRWGDFRLPAVDRKLGVEAQRVATGLVDAQGAVHYSTEGASELCDFGLKFWRLGPFPKDVDCAELESRLAKLQKVESGDKFILGDQEYAWRPYSFSWRWGVENAPGRQGYHGLKERIDSRFIALGKRTNGFNETVFGEEEHGSIYYLWTTVGVIARDAAAEASDVLVDLYVSAGAPNALYLDGRALDLEHNAINLTLRQDGQTTPVLCRYDSAGRRALCFVARTSAERTSSRLIHADGQDSGAFNGLSTGLNSETPDFVSSPRTALSTIWFDVPGVLDFQARGSQPRREALKFLCAPGVASLEIPCYGRVEKVCVNGQEVEATRETRVIDGKDFYAWDSVRTGVPAQNDGANEQPPIGATLAQRPVTMEFVRFQEPIREAATIELLFTTKGSATGGAILPEPIEIECQRGVMPLGNWNDRGVLANYSGGVRYIKRFTWDGQERFQGRAILRLTRVSASCRVKLNGQAVGDLVAQPWNVDVTDALCSGENILEVETYNTLSNFYRNIPSGYKGSTDSGLFGPVTIQSEPQVTLTE
ncbi:MAG: glycosyl hydrolase [Planctomycetia bacterium]|nr:glycosyl hydrolase [Planctomycetia bacterium]